MKKTSIKIPKIKNRVTWGFNPATRIVKSKKLYNRKKYQVDKILKYEEV